MAGAGPHHGIQPPIAVTQADRRDLGLRSDEDLRGLEVKELFVRANYQKQLEKLFGKQPEKDAK